MKLPVRDLLRSEPPPFDDKALWLRVETKRRNLPRRRAFLVLSVAAAALLFVGIRRFGASVLQLSGGEPIHVLLASESARTFTLTDGSRIELSSGASVHAVSNEPSRILWALHQGKATFDVKPGGGRLWLVEAGLVTVEVVGTRFSVERFASRVDVRVERGSVVVRGERVPDRAVRVDAGGHFEIDAGSPAAAGADPVDAGPMDAGPVDAGPVDAGPMDAGPLEEPSSIDGASAGSDAGGRAGAEAIANGKNTAWRDYAKRGEHAKAYDALGTQGVSRAAEGASVAELLELADVAQLSGHAGEAVTPLSRIVSQHPSDPNAPLAAFTLGRLQLDQLGQPAAAATSFSKALSLGLSGGLAEDALSRLVEARARSGDRVGAKAAALEYEKRFPGGRRAASVRKWTDAD